MRNCGTKPIETPRLFLRPFVRTDAEIIYRNWSSNPNVTRFLTWSYHRSIEETERLLAEWLNSYRRKNFYQWAIVLKERGEPIGAIGCFDIDRWNQEFEIGYSMGEAFWGNGYMTEAANAVVDFMFRQVKCRRIVAKYAAQNIGSRRVMEKIGMVPAPEDAQILRTPNGTFTCPIYEINASDRLFFRKDATT